MATLIFVNKENGEAGSPVAPKNGLKPGSGPVKALDGRAQVSAPQVGKVFRVPPALPKAARKALGTVNRATEKSVKTNRVPKQKKPSFTAKKLMTGSRFVGGTYLLRGGCLQEITLLILLR
jgi:securin